MINVRTNLRARNQAPRSRWLSWLQQTHRYLEKIVITLSNLSNKLNEQIDLIILLIPLGNPRLFGIPDPSYLCGLLIPSLPQCLLLVIFPSEI